MTNQTNDPLRQLLINESQPVNKKELAELLLPYVAINKETKFFDFTSQFMDLSNDEKILIMLSAVKARSIVLPDVEDKITPIEIIKMEVMPEGSVKGTLKKLLASNEIKVNKKRYYLPNYKISQIVVRFKNLKS